jgi:hypothetical protein
MKFIPQNDQYYHLPKYCPFLVNHPVAACTTGPRKEYRLFILRSLRYQDPENPGRKLKNYDARILFCLLGHDAV